MKNYQFTILEKYIRKSWLAFEILSLCLALIYSIVWLNIHSFDQKSLGGSIFLVSIILGISILDFRRRFSRLYKKWKIARDASNTFFKGVSLIILSFTTIPEAILLPKSILISSGILSIGLDSAMIWVNLHIQQFNLQQTPVYANAWELFKKTSDLDHLDTVYRKYIHDQHEKEQGLEPEVMLAYKIQKKELCKSSPSLNY